MEALGVLGFVFGMMGLIAFVRLEKLTNNIETINFERIQKLDCAGAFNLCNSSF